jgi:hypothetical protein
MNHLFASLQAAAKCAVEQDGFDIKQMRFERWAVTYRCSEADVETALKIAMNGSRKLPEEISASAPPVPSNAEDME